MWFHYDIIVEGFVSLACFLEHELTALTSYCIWLIKVEQCKIEA